MEEVHSNISSQQIEIFNKVINKWRTEYMQLEKMNTIRIPSLLKYLKNSGFISAEMAETEKPLTGLNILDIGCGVGLMSEPLAMLGANVTGIDAAENAIECAKYHARKNNITNNLTYIYDKIENFADINSKKYDVIVASEIVEHVNAVDLFLAACLKTLKPKGAIFITTINKTIRSWLVAIILYENILRTIPKGVHEWNKFISPKDLEQSLKKYDCTVINKRGFKYNYFSDIFTHCDDLSVFYDLFAIKK